ncbi:MAG: UDP-N-acetylglucosamine--LPS N-acetylglucosamine transferase [Clostridia bacterium]|nr:UDP-N-acetylglucosamine--LPS N-acetylglucosamine transferase [Clostridia bacterium]
MNALFLSVSTGKGHFKAAEALREAVENKYPLSQNLIIDSLKYINPVVDKLVVGSYLTTVKANPYIYKKIYEISELNDHFYLFSKAINNLFSHKIRSLISQTNPSVVVCTHPFPLQMLSILKKKGMIDTPVAAILTDYVSHNFWVHESIDAYIVAHEGMKLELIKRGISEKVVYPYGIPVSSHFQKKKSKQTLLQELNLENKTTILVMGGSLGLGEIENAFNALLAVDRELQIIILTGDNSKIKQKLEFQAACSDKTIRILGYTHRVSDYMDVSDLLITKPGGMTISEALVKELPTLIISPIPGHEEGNAGFLTRQGAAIRVDNTVHLDQVLTHLLDHPSTLQRMKKAAGKLSKPAATKDILCLLESLASNRYLDAFSP